jgi:hypothetical protein
MRQSRANAVDIEGRKFHAARRIEFGGLTLRIVVPAVSTIVAASAPAALQLVDLFVQAVEFLFGQLPFVIGLLQCAHDSFQIAQNRFEAVANAIDLSAQHAIDRTIAFVPGFTACSAIATLPAAITIAWVVAPLASAPTVWRAHVAATLEPAFASARFNGLPIGFRAFFVKLIGFMRFFGDRFTRPFAFRRLVDRRRNILVFVTRSIFAFRFASAKFILFAGARLFAILGTFRRVTFTRRAIVTTARATAAFWAARANTSAARRTTSSAAATASAAIAITRITTFRPWTIAAGARRTRRRGAFARLRFGIAVLRSGMRRRRGFPSF